VYTPGYLLRRAGAIRSRELAAFRDLSLLHHLIVYVVRNKWCLVHFLRCCLPSSARAKWSIYKMADADSTALGWLALLLKQPYRAKVETI
jgi:hypothetical protein